MLDMTLREILNTPINLETALIFIGIAWYVMAWRMIRWYDYHHPGANDVGGSFVIWLFSPIMFPVIGIIKLFVVVINAMFGQLK